MIRNVLLLFLMFAPLHTYAEEIYVVGGGAGCIALERGAGGKPRVAFASMEYSTSATKWLAYQDGDSSLTIEVDESTSRGVYGHHYYQFSRSSDGRNWDLKATDYNYRKKPELYSPPEDSAGVPYYLYRLDEPLVVDHFRALARAHEEYQNPTSSTLSAIRNTAVQLLAKHRKNPYVHVIYLDMLLRTNADAELSNRFHEWSQGLRASTIKHRHVAALVEAHIHSRELSAAGKNAYDFRQEISGRTVDLATRFRRFPEILNYAEHVQPQPSLTMPVPNFLDIQVVVKVLRVMGQFAEMKGRRAEAVRVHIACYHTGLLMSSELSLIPRLIGAALRTIATHALFLYAANSCETEAEFAELWALLDKEATISIKPLHPDVAAYGKLLWALHYRSRDSFSNSHDTGAEATVRENVADTKFNLLRTGTAALYVKARTGKFLENDMQFAPFLAKPEPDPFTSTSLQCLLTPTTFTVYSAGPDKKDEYALIDYDPTNGTISAGDIAWRIPKEREFPYPRTGLRASTRDELLRYMPNGFPPDPFASTRGLGYGVSNTKPVAIYSFGPDVNQEQAVGDPNYGGTAFHEKARLYVPQVHYDPTNGIVSDGDLFTTIPPSR